LFYVDINLHIVCRPARSWHNIQGLTSQFNSLMRSLYLKRLTT